MRVTTKGQVTIPQHIREKLEITPNSEIDFHQEKSGRVYLKKVKQKADAQARENRFRRFRGIATVRMSTEEILALTRGSR